MTTRYVQFDIARYTVTIVMTAAIFSAGAQTATPQPAGSAPAGEASPQPAPGEERTSPARRRIEFSPDNIAAAFGYIDKNGDNNISREEAAGFRGVARNFDRADVDRNGNLSRSEFENAMNRAKSR